MSEARREATYREAAHADAEDVRGPLWEEAVAAGAARGPLVPADDADDEATGPDEADGNLRRYARWQWRDFWRRRGGWLALGALLGVWLLTYLAWHGGGPNGMRGPMPAEGVRAVAHVFFTFGGALAALLGVGGIVSRERERGLQRFMFAKPVRPLRYYLQGFALNSLGALLVVAGAVLLAALLLGSLIPVGTVLGVAVGAYLLTAGVTFLASTLIRLDAPVAAVWLLAGFPVLAASENHWAVARILVWLFPQGFAAALVKAAGLTSGPGDFVRFGAIVVLVGVLYGLLAFAGGVAVLRRRAIST